MGKFGSTIASSIGERWVKVLSKQQIGEIGVIRASRVLALSNNNRAATNLRHMMFCEPEIWVIRIVILRVNIC